MRFPALSKPALIGTSWLVLVVYTGIIIAIVALAGNGDYETAHPPLSLAVLTALGTLWLAHKVDRLHPVQLLS